MVKKQKKHYSSFKEDGQTYLQCKRCYEYVHTSDDAVAITCSRCVTLIQMAKFPETLPSHSVKKKTGRPPGWHWMAEFVDKDGKVFHRGKEQPKLKGTLKPTKVKPIKKRKKLTADEKLFKRAADWKKRLKLKRGKK